MTNAELFLDLYKQLEQAAVTVYGLPPDGSAVSRLERFAQYKDIRSQLKYCREVRALLTHNPMIRGSYAVEPGDGMIDTIKEVIDRIKEPTRCRDRAVRLGNILTAVPEDEVIPKMKLMKSFGFSYIPIMNGKRVVGVFGKSTIFSYILDSQGVKISEGTRFVDISKYLSLSRKDKYSYRFINKDMYIFEAERLVINAFRKKERINLMFLTETGSAEEELWGIITPWDVMEG